MIKKINWPDVLAKCKSSEENLKVIVDIIIKIVEKILIYFRVREGHIQTTYSETEEYCLDIRKSYIKNYKIQTQQTRKLS